MDVTQTSLFTSMLLILCANCDFCSLASATRLTSCWQALCSSLYDEAVATTFLHKAEPTRQPHSGRKHVFKFVWAWNFIARFASKYVPLIWIVCITKPIFDTACANCGLYCLPVASTTRLTSCWQALCSSCTTRPSPRHSNSFTKKSQRSSRTHERNSCFLLVCLSLEFYCSVRIEICPINRDHMHCITKFIFDTPICTA